MGKDEVERWLRWEGKFDSLVIDGVRIKRVNGI